jgi:DNA-3-methyladenine glycosylase I
VSATVSGPDGRPRCAWFAAAPEFLAYHDTEWGFPIDDDYRLFEKLCLEGFQSGLSWRTILAKRENFRSAFHSFDFNRIMAKMMLTAAPDLDAFEAQRGLPKIRNPQLAHENPAWVRDAEKRQLHLLRPTHTPETIHDLAN